MAKVDIDQSKQLQGLLNVCGADLQLERTSEYDIRDAESSQGFAEKARAIAGGRVCPRYDDVDSRRRRKFAEVLNQLNQPAGDLWEELDTATGDGDGRRLVQEWRFGRQTLELNSQSLSAKKTMPSVYVGNLPLSVTKRELAGLFSACGEVHDVWLANRRPDMEHTYAFVRFYDPESCVLACESMRGVEVRGRAMRVNIADEPIRDRTHKDTLIKQDPVGRYYPKTENSEEKKLVWTLRQSCSTFHSQHVLYANQFFLQLKDPQPGAGFCANRLVVDFDEVLSWLEDIPEDLAPAVGDEGPAYTLQRDGKDSRDAIPEMKKSNSETNSLAFASVMTSQGSSLTSNSNDHITTNGIDSTESNIEQNREHSISKQSSTTYANANVMSPSSGAALASLSFKSPEKGNTYLREPRKERVHPSTERVPGTGQLSPLALLSPPTTANAKIMPPASDAALASLSFKSPEKGKKYIHEPQEERVHRPAERVPGTRQLSLLSPPTTANAKISPPASDSALASLGFKSPEKGNTYLHEPRGERVHPSTGTGQLSPLALLSPPTSANTKIMPPACDSTLAALSFKSPEKGNTYLRELVGPQGERVHPSTGTGQLSPLALLSPPSGRPIKRMSPSSRRHYRSPQCLYPVPGAPYPTMLSTTVPAAFPSSMFDQQDDVPVTNCPVGELIKLNEDPPNDVQLIDLDQKQSDAKTSSSYTRELVALFEGNGTPTQELKDELSVQPFKSNLQLLEELLGGCEVCSSNDVVEGATVDHELGVEMNHTTEEGGKASIGQVDTK